MTFEIKVEEDLGKEQKYILLLPQIRSLVDGEKNLIANLANIAASLHHTFNEFIWTGFYLAENEEELVLGPFQGKAACTRINKGKGVCGAAMKEKRTIVIKDVNNFPGHIVCDPASRSEIVVPVIKNGKVIAVLDIDSDITGAFNETDEKYLESLLKSVLHIF